MTTEGFPALADLAAIRVKYRQERDRRVRSDGEDQYLSVQGDFSSFAEDPFVEPGFARAPLQRHHDVVIIGAGFAGLMMVAELAGRGVRDVAVIDEAGDVGGTWYWNRYPAAQCDVESYCYLPLLEETGYVPEHRYSYQPEILTHAQRIARQWGVYENAIFQTVVTEMRWDDEAAHWRIATDRGDSLAAQVVVFALGPGSKPKLPRVPGIETYRGRLFHTSRWDYDYTGGGTEGGMSKLADKTVGFVGTGSTGVSVVPLLAADSEHLVLFQRTPAMVLRRDQRPTDYEWAKSLEPGWHRARQRNLENIMGAKPVDEDLVNDEWTSYARSLLPLGADDCPGVDLATRAELADLRLLDAVRTRVQDTVDDPAVAELLKPWYRALCKRPTFSDTYLETFNRPNVTLVDVSATQGIERFTEAGVVVGDEQYDLDCMIFSTGFEWGTSLRRRIPVSVVGRGGLELHRHWADGMRTFQGHSVAGFPNWFYIGRTQAAVTVNYPATIAAQVEHVASILAEVRRRGASVVEVTQEAESGWLGEIARLTVDRSEVLEACTPGYINNEGQPRERNTGFQLDRYAPGLVAFEEYVAEWRRDGDLAGMVLR